jgi:BirA family biotin operon repressor/biotin-[acetyl-CoA-carboxylase] ligase
MALDHRTIAARRLRREATDVEGGLWYALRAAALPSKLRRQHPIGRRIVDFACPSCKLVIELDGGQHDADAQADARRTAEIAEHGYRVIRFWNNEVIDNLDGVRETIRRELAGFPHLTLTLSAPKDGGGEGTLHRQATLAWATKPAAERPPECRYESVLPASITVIEGIHWDTP